MAQPQSPVGIFLEALELDGFRIGDDRRLEGTAVSLGTLLDATAVSYVRRALVSGRLNARDLVPIAREYRNMATHQEASPDGG